MCIERRIVAPSLVTCTSWFLGPGPVGIKILSIPLGPSVVFRESATAIAPIKEDSLANSPFS